MGIAISAPVAPPDPVGDALAIILTTKSGREFAAWCNALASRQHYADAANRLQCAVFDRVPNPHPAKPEGDPNAVDWASENSLIRALYLGGDFEVFRVARAVKFVVGEQNEAVTLADILPIRTREARLALAALGYVNGLPWDERWPLPRDKRERAALALNLLVRTMYP